MGVWVARPLSSAPPAAFPRREDGGGTPSSLPQRSRCGKLLGEPPLHTPDKAETKAWPTKSTKGSRKKQPLNHRNQHESSANELHELKRIRKITGTWATSPRVQIVLKKQVFLRQEYTPD
jgi:hypothetical protein